MTKDAKCGHVTTYFCLKFDKKDVLLTITDITHAEHHHSSRATRMFVLVRIGHRTCPAGMKRRNQKWSRDHLSLAPGAIKNVLLATREHMRAVNYFISREIRIQFNVQCPVVR